MGYDRLKLVDEGAPRQRSTTGDRLDRFQLHLDTSSKDQAGHALELLKATAGGRRRQFRANQHIALEGGHERYILGVVSGVVRCFRISMEGKRYICRFGAAGSLAGLQFSGVLPFCSTEAVTDCEVIIFRAAAVEAVLDNNSLVRQAFLQMMVEELAQKERVAFRLARMTSHQRVADFLLELSGNGRRTSVHLVMSRMDIADHLGLTFETVSRSLHKLDCHDLIRLHNPRHFEVIDLDGLQDFVGESLCDVPTDS